jgi:hypothetical protein
MEPEGSLVLTVSICVSLLMGVLREVERRADLVVGFDEFAAVITARGRLLVVLNRCVV